MKLILGVDAAAHGRRELQLTASLDFRDLSLTLVNVVEMTDVRGAPYPSYPGAVYLANFTKGLDDLGHQALEEAAVYAYGLNFKQFKRHLTHGHVANELIKYADSSGADVICVGAPTTSEVASLLTGGVARKLVIGAHQSLLLARPGHKKPWTGRAVFAVDHSPYTDRCVDELLTLAPQGLRTLRLLTVVPRKQMQMMHDIEAPEPETVQRDIEDGLSRRQAELAHKLAGLGCKIECTVVFNEIQTAIRDEMKADGGADLLILGAQGHGFLQRLKVGSTTLGVTVHGDFPTLILRPNSEPAAPD